MTGRTVYTLRVTSTSPLLMSENPGTTGEPEQSLPYIPAGPLRGAVAARLLQGRSLGALDEAAREVFRDLFLRGRVRYGAMLPVLHEEATPLPTPLSLWTCKDHPWPDYGHHGLVDLLAHSLGQARPPLVRCAREGCGYELERVRRPFIQTLAGNLADVQPPGRLITHTAIENGRGTARRAMLYSLMPLDTGVTFAGSLVCDTELEADMQRLLPRAAQLSIGADRTRGLGHIQVSALQSSPGGPYAAIGSVAQRIDAFNRHLRSVQSTGILPASTYIPITMVSDTVLLDHYLAPVQVPQRDVLARYARLWGLHEPPDGLEPVEWVLAGRVVGGWNMQLGAPRPRRTAARSGSVWVFRLPEKLTDQAVSWLEDLEREGVGEQAAEGYGAVVVGSPLHLQNGGSLT